MLIDDVRPDESRAMADFLVSATRETSALFLEGEPGIGKTTLWLAGLDRARERGFVVLSAQAATAESVLAYAALADLLSGLDSVVFSDLPEPQRFAIDRVLLRGRVNDDAMTDQRTVAAAFLSVIEHGIRSRAELGRIMGQ